MMTLRRSRDLTIALTALVVAIVCAAALSIGIVMRHNQIAASPPYPPGFGMGPGMMTGPGVMGPGRSPVIPSCSAPALPGTVVDITSPICTG